MGEGAEFEAGVEKLLNKARKPGIFVTLTKQNTRKQANFKKYEQEVNGCVNNLTKKIYWLEDVDNCDWR
jgi:DNA-binding transcriptional regulator YhcF (GntR family)